MFPLWRADLHDVLAVADRRLADEWDGVETTARFGDLEPVRGVQSGIVAERLHEIPGADVPPAAQRRVAVEVQLLVLNAPAMDEVLILPDPVDDDVARESLHQRARLAVRREARIDIRVHD